MNIFVLDKNPAIAAQMHCDKHVPKMIVEHAQMLATAYYHTIGISRKKEFKGREDEIARLFSGFPRKKEDGSDHPYSVTHVNHPCTIWTRTSIENFDWTLQCTEALCDEFFNRWKNKQHSVRWIIEWMKQNPPTLLSSEQTPFATAMPICYMSEDAVQSYRKYYAFKTSYMKVVWKKLNNKPTWFTDEFVAESLASYMPNPVPEKKPRKKNHHKSNMAIIQQEFRHDPIIIKI